MISGLFCKDPVDPAWDSDAGMQQFRAFMAKYLPSADISDGFYVWGYGASYLLWKVLEQCGGDFSRENVMKQATNVKNLEVPVLLPGIRVNTSPPITIRFEHYNSPDGTARAGYASATFSRAPPRDAV